MRHLLFNLYWRLFGHWSRRTIDFTESGQGGAMIMSALSKHPRPPAMSIDLSALYPRQYGRCNKCDVIYRGAHKCSARILAAKKRRLDRESIMAVDSKSPASVGAGDSNLTSISRSEKVVKFNGSRRM